MSRECPLAPLSVTDYLGRVLFLGTISVLTSVCCRLRYPAAEVPTNGHKPEYVSVRVVCERYGWHKIMVHRLLSRKRITGKKDGRKTMVHLPSVEAYVQSLPDR